MASCIIYNRLNVLIYILPGTIDICVIVSDNGLAKKLREVACRHEAMFSVIKRNGKRCDRPEIDKGVVYCFRRLQGQRFRDGRVSRGYPALGS